jgi:hypothetical protein
VPVHQQQVNWKAITFGIATFILLIALMLQSGMFMHGDP